MHEQDSEEESLEPIQSEDRMTVVDLKYRRKSGTENIPLENFLLTLRSMDRLLERKMQLLRPSSATGSREVLGGAWSQ
ncbi:hypothetical protein TNCV_1866761 [Trichonephila clavipes]|nr:hypothetical protein TNCV_1866761 [Trichonephila clavipes]